MRAKTAKTRQTLPDEKYKSTRIAKLISLCMHDGKKSVAQIRTVLASTLEPMFSWINWRLPEAVQRSVKGSMAGWAIIGMPLWVWQGVDGIRGLFEKAMQVAGQGWEPLMVFILMASLGVAGFWFNRFIAWFALSTRLKNFFVDRIPKTGALFQ